MVSGMSDSSTMLSRDPEMIYRSVRIEIREPVTFGVMTVHVGVADVDVTFGGEFRFDAVEMVLQDGECDRNAVLLPHALLTTDRPVRATPDDVAELVRFPHPRDRDVARRI